MSTTDFLNSLDYDQLRFCRDKCNEMIKSIQEEEKKVAWAVTDGSINFGWFRTEDYLKAVKCLESVAVERWEDSDKSNPETRRWLNFAIDGQRLPVSEYDKLFADGQWG